MNDTLLQLLGRTHVLAVHFPIALIWVAAVLELFHRGTGRSPLAFTCLGLGALAAVVAASLGWIHAAAEPLGSSVARTLFWHRWIGVGAASVTTVAFLLACGARRPGRLAQAYRAVLLVAVVLVSAGGHLGGTLVFGEGYFTELVGDLFERPAKPNEAPDEPPSANEGEPAPAEPVPSEEVAPPVPGEPVASLELWTTHVRPLFEARCVECHGPRRKKGNLRLDDLTAQFERAPADRAIVPGNALASELYRRVRLPADDEDVMPAKGELLSASEIEYLREWIDAGAPWSNEGAAPDATEPDATEPGATETGADAEAAADARGERLDDAALDAELGRLRALGASAMRVAAGSPFVDVSYVMLRERATDADVEAVRRLAAHLWELDLSGTAISDRTLALLDDCVELRRLRLGDTAVTDVGLLSATSLDRLQSLNLVGTAVTDAGLEPLGDLPALARLYLWRTQVTDEGVARLQERRPELVIVRGVDAESSE